MARPSGRAADELRPISLEINVSKHAEGSCLTKFGDTHVLCVASVENRVPPFLRNTGRGWVTAEYGMLPRSTTDRLHRERTLRSGRTLEIQRLIGRSLRAITALDGFGEHQIRVDCDVIQADGGTRTAAVTGGFVALHLAFQHLQRINAVKKIPLNGQVAAVSCGLLGSEALLDLDYAEDSTAQADANFVMTNKGGLVEIQATAETTPFGRDKFDSLLALAQRGITSLIAEQARVLGL